MDMPKTTSSAKRFPLAVIGGSGVYSIEELKEVKEIAVKTPFGNPSDKVITGVLEGTPVAFLPRHGRGHRVNPSEVNYRANIYALKTLGVEQIISVSACGSLKEELAPRDMVFPDQIFDRTKSRPSTFFEKGLVAHVGVANPYCTELSERLYNQAERLGFRTHKGGTYVCIEGPQFSTKAESKVYRSLGFSVIGMTNLPEAKLAREAEICYSAVALVTDYDVWKEDEEVNVEKVIANLVANTANVKKLLKTVISSLARERNCECASALKFAMLTDLKIVPPATKKALLPLIGKYIG
jgi:5'-methylthioadenosine phosphorylase